MRTQEYKLYADNTKVLLNTGERGIVNKCESYPENGQTVHLYKIDLPDGTFLRRQEDAVMIDRCEYGGEG